LYSRVILAWMHGNGQELSVKYIETLIDFSLYKAEKDVYPVYTINRILFYKVKPRANFILLSDVRLLSAPNGNASAPVRGC
jgi:hypothetical protein